MRLSDARAVVTGGAQGMGYTFTRELAGAGAHVAFCDLDAARVAAVAAELGVTGVVADVSQEGDVVRLFDEATAAIGVPNLLINNAGILRDQLLIRRDWDTGAVQGLDLDRWNEVLAVNLTGPFLCARELARRCVETGVSDAVIVNMSSISRAGNAGQSNYSAAKAALAADTVVWAKELARYGIRVGAIAPGFIRTPMIEGMRPEMLAKVTNPVPLGRLGEPEEVFAAVRFIVECGYFTGRVVEVDGGLRL